MGLWVAVADGASDALLDENMKTGAGNAKTVSFGKYCATKNQTDAPLVRIVRSKQRVAISSLLLLHPNRPIRTAIGISSRTCSVCAAIRRERDVYFPSAGGAMDKVSRQRCSARVRVSV